MLLSGEVGTPLTRTHAQSVERLKNYFQAVVFTIARRGRIFFRKGKIFIYLFIFCSFKSTVFFGIRKKTNVRINLRAEAVAAERPRCLVCSGCHQIPTGFASSSPSCYLHRASFSSCSPAYISLMALSPFQVPTAAGEHPEDGLPTE